VETREQLRHTFWKRKLVRSGWMILAGLILQGGNSHVVFIQRSSYSYTFRAIITVLYWIIAKAVILLQKVHPVNSPIPVQPMMLPIVVTRLAPRDNRWLRRAILWLRSLLLFLIRITRFLFYETLRFRAGGVVHRSMHACSVVTRAIQGTTTGLFLAFDSNSSGHLYQRSGMLFVADARRALVVPYDLSRSVFAASLTISRTGKSCRPLPDGIDPACCLALTGRSTQLTTRGTQIGVFYLMTMMIWPPSQKT
jgi:hypothetical protein